MTTATMTHNQEQSDRDEKHEELLHSQGKIEHTHGLQVYAIGEQRVRYPSVYHRCTVDASRHVPQIRESTVGRRRVEDEVLSKGRCGVMFVSVCQHISYYVL